MEYLEFDQTRAAAETEATSVLVVRCLGRKRLAARSRFSRRIINVRKVVSTRFLTSSDKRTLPVPRWASLTADAAR